MKTVSGTTKCSSAGAASLRPSTADNTEIAGVIMESPMNIEAPTTPSASKGQLLRPRARWPSAISESVPPSPLLSARSSSSTYFAVTTIKSAHRISDSTPSTMTRVTGWPCAAPATASRNAYSGEVPMSPNTTPILPSVRAQKPVVAGPSWAWVDVTLTAMVMENALSYEIDPAGYDAFPSSQRLDHSSRERRHNATAAKIRQGYIELRLQIGRDRRVFAHQRNGDASVRRQGGVVRKQRLAVGFARDRKDMGRWQPLSLEDLTHRVRPIRRQVERPVIALGRHEARRGVTDDRYSQRRRLEG